MDFSSMTEKEREDWKRCEMEAHWFAIAFLTPEKEFRESFAKHEGYIPLVAEEFGVASRFAQRRAVALGLIDPATLKGE